MVESKLITDVQRVI